MFANPAEKPVIYHRFEGARNRIKRSVLNNVETYKQNSPVDCTTSVLHYMDECANEVIKMKNHTAGNLSLYDLVISAVENLNPSLLHTITEDEIKLKYDIYQDMILAKFRRGKLLRLLRNAHVLGLNPDCLLLIADFLSNDELYYLTQALHLD